MTGARSLQDLLNVPLEKEVDDGYWQDLAFHLRLAARFALRGLSLAPYDIEDVVQEVILRLMDGTSLRRTVREARTPRLYLARALRNIGVDLLRRQERHRRLDEVAEPLAPGNEIERIHDGIATHRLVSKLQELSAEDRDLLRLRFWDELTLSEIAERHGIAISTAYLRLNRALASIRHAMSVPRSE